MLDAKCLSQFYFSDDEKGETLDAILSNAYCRSQMYLSKQMAQLRPEITMPMFSGEFFFFYIYMYAIIIII